MVDLETLSTSSNSVILTFAAIPFGPDGKLILPEEWYFYERVHLPSYEKYKNNEFHFSYQTLLWWLSQDTEPMNDAFLAQPRYPIWTVLQDFVNWVGLVGNHLNDTRVNVWSHGKDFDVVVLENAFKVCGIECPWKYYDTRDTRTLYALTGVDMRNIAMPEGFKAHNAVGDCLKQIEGIRLAYDTINKHIYSSAPDHKNNGNDNQGDNNNQSDNNDNQSDNNDNQDDNNNQGDNEDDNQRKSQRSRSRSRSVSRNKSKSRTTKRQKV